MQSLYLYTVGKTFDREGISCCQVCLAEFNNDFCFCFIVICYYYSIIISYFAVLFMRTPFHGNYGLEWETIFAGLLSPDKSHAALVAEVAREGAFVF